MPPQSGNIPFSCRILGAAFLAIALNNGAAAEEGRSWHYGPSGDDSSWGGVCASGTEQSPIALNDWNKSGQVRPISFAYKMGSKATIANNGYTLVVSPEAENTIEVGGESYRLAQFHFHTLSEHLIEGKRYPMEVHLVHVDEAGNPRVVIGVLIADDLDESDAEENSAHKLLGALQLRTEQGETSEAKLNVMDLMPADDGKPRLERVEFNGSLTTPGCSEGLTWIVMRERLQTTPEVIAKFHGIMGDNYRRVQPLNGREINCCGEDEPMN